MNSRPHRYEPRHAALRPPSRLAPAVAPKAMGALIAGGSVVATSATGLATSAPAQAAAAKAPRGDITVAVHNTFNNRVQVRGWAYDPRRPHRAIGLRLYAGGKYLGRVVAPADGHRFSKTFTLNRKVRAVTAKSRGAGKTYARIPGQLVKRKAPAPGKRVVSIAKRYVGDRYVYGGSSPKQGFDCSGYTSFAYRKAGVADLPHNSDAQEGMRAMKTVARRNARPGDLVFYHDGGSTYHVSIYAGRGMQYSATNPQQGVEYDRIFAKNVTFGRLAR